MNDLLLIACGAGVRDGINPCIFMTCAAFIMQSLWLKKMDFQMGWLHFIFGFVYVISVFVFNFGPAQVFVLQKSFIFVAKILYFILGFGAFIAGILFFKDWFLLSRGLAVKGMIGKEIKLTLMKCAVVYLATVVLAVVLSAFATLWPVNKYIIILGNAAIAKGQWQMVMPLLVSYVVVSIWVLWFVWAFLSIKNLRPSLLKIFCSSIFFTASSCMILMFK